MLLRLGYVCRVVVLLLTTVPLETVILTIVLLRTISLDFPPARLLRLLASLPCDPVSSTEESNSLVVVPDSGLIRTL